MPLAHRVTLQISAIDRGSVLIVEDDPSIRALVKGVLEEVGYPVREATDGAAALDALRHEQPLAVVLDLGLPYVDGSTVARAARSLHQDDVPILVISASPTADVEAREIGASGLLRKPFLVEELEVVVGRALAGRDALTPAERAIADRRALELDALRALRA